jgi:hypothetical protein
MDLRAYYRKVRGIEAELREDSVVVVSRETGDGGRAGVKADVPRALGARMIADEKADLATEDEAMEFRAGVERKWRAGDDWASRAGRRQDRLPHAEKTLPLGRGSVAESDRRTS